MEYKKKVCLEYTKDERVYSFQIADNAPLSETYEALCVFLEEVVRLINEHAQKITPQPVEEDDKKSDEPA